MNFVKRLLPAAMLLVSACTTSGDMGLGLVEPGRRPALNTVEAGLWYKMDKFENRLAVSALVERDPELNAYLRSVICRLAPEHCDDIKLFVLKHPYFNATMAPNGSMHVWTGLLLRAENEEQLATVLGHELAHYLNRHSIKKWNSVKATTEFLTFFSIATGGIGFGFVGLAASIGAVGGLNAYSRDLETEADRDGLSLIHKAGYDTGEAAILWQRIKEEKDASDDEKKSIFWSTHPPTEQRIESLQNLSAELKINPVLVQYSKNNQFETLVTQHWMRWTEELISTRAFDEALVVMDQLQERNFDPSALEFYRGEIFRRRSDEGDLEQALKYYQSAAAINSAPPKTYKHMALVEKRLGNSNDAIQHFELYLEQNPESADLNLVRSYIQQLRN